MYVPDAWPAGLTPAWRFVVGERAGGSTDGGGVLRVQDLIVEVIGNVPVDERRPSVPA